MTAASRAAPAPRRAVPLATSLLATLILGGCGTGTYLGDTVTWFGFNPNRPIGNSENMRRASGQVVVVAPLGMEPGNVWPGPPPPIPSLYDIQRQEQGNTNFAPQSVPDLPDSRQPTRNGGLPSNQPALPPNLQVPPLPPVTTPAPGVVPPGPPPTGSVLTPNGPAMTSPGPGTTRLVTPPGSGGQGILVPNGNGTSTLIGPDGTVSTVPTPR